MAAPHSVDILIGGLGPGGATAAAIASRSGLSVMGVEARALGAGAHDWGNRWQQTILKTPAQGILADLGLQERLFGAPGSTFINIQGSRDGLLALGGAERAAVDVAEQAGAELRWSTPVTDARQLTGGGVEVELDGGRDAVRAATYIDATGGRSPFLNRLGFGMSDPLGPERTYFIGQYPYQAPAPGRRPQAQWLSLGLQSAYGPANLAVLNHPTHGAHVDVILGTSLAGMPPAQAAEVHRQIAKLGGIQGEQLQSPYFVRRSERLARRARSRDVLAIGDGISRKRPGSTAGVNAAIEDAAAAVDAARISGPGREAALRAYGRGRLVHHASRLHPDALDAAEAIVIAAPN